MKQKLIYAVLIVACIYMPAASKECGKVCIVTGVKTELPAKDKIMVETEELDSLPVSPFVSTLINM